MKKNSAYIGEENSGISPVAGEDICYRPIVWKPIILRPFA